ncbi:DUF6268 family outer membrane beta-barrel protein [Flavobacterium sp.]|jgi:hypothetical protein|uniref:DUF6268 family outer membrane beta-barrel protein n=1 Tax=Flavobacterium sp. TaxID=239 RepID=UPI0037C07F04
MKKIKLFMLFGLFTVSVSAQDYVDIFKLSLNNATLGNLDNDYETSVNNLNMEVYYPKKLSEKTVLLTGFTVENTRLNFSEGAERTSLTMTRLNLGMKYQHSEKWSGTYVFLPKIASDFDNIGSNDFQFGGLAVLDYQYNETSKVKFGLYASSENHGSTITPLIGIWHRSKDSKFYINATLPIRMDANYSLSDKFSVGADLLTSIKSYDLDGINSDLYTQEESIRFALYAALGLMENSIILRGKVGFDTTDYGVYNSNEKVGAQVLTFPLSTDKRNRLNSEFDSSLYIGFDAIYRFDLTKESK